MCKENPQGLTPAELYHMERQLTNAVEAALTPPSRVCVLEHTVHGILGNIADRVRNCAVRRLHPTAPRQESPQPTFTSILVRMQSDSDTLCSHIHTCRDARTIL